MLTYSHPFTGGNLPGPLFSLPLSTLQAASRCSELIGTYTELGWHISNIGMKVGHVCCVSVARLLWLPPLPRLYLPLLRSPYLSRLRLLRISRDDSRLCDASRLCLPISRVSLTVSLSHSFTFRTLVRPCAGLHASSFRLQASGLRLQA